MTSRYHAREREYTNYIKSKNNVNIKRKSMKISIVFIFIFSVSCVFVINALWYQPCFHPSPLVKMRQNSGLDACKEPNDLEKNNFVKEKGLDFERFASNSSIKSESASKKHFEKETQASILAKNANSFKKSPELFLQKIQQGLQAFGHSTIVANGKMDSKTKDAILEFQALFGLPQTGKADSLVYEKMKKEKIIE